MNIEQRIAESESRIAQLEKELVKKTTVNTTLYGKEIAHIFVQAIEDGIIRARRTQD